MIPIQDLSPEWLMPAACRLTIVFGPPGSGKSTYVSKVSKQGDRVIDLDSIRAELINQPLYHGGDDGLHEAIRERNRRLGELAVSAQPTWFITTGQGKRNRRWWEQKLKPKQVITLRPPAEECIRRIKADPRRPPDVIARHVKAVPSWYAADQRSKFDNSTERIRGRQLQERRFSVWVKDPTCARCGKLVSYPAGFELDHILALDNGGSDTEGNVQILCAPEGCHAIKTAEDLGFKHRPKRKIGTDGWPE